MDAEIIFHDSFFLLIKLILNFFNCMCHPSLSHHEWRKINKPLRSSEWHHKQLFFYLKNWCHAKSLLREKWLCAPFYSLTIVVFFMHQNFVWKLKQFMKSRKSLTRINLMTPHFYNLNLYMRAERWVKIWTQSG